MNTFYLIRHGQKQSTTPDPELTVVGHEQAGKTGAFLREKPISQIIASPMVRTQQTADHIASALSLPIQSDHRLKERMDYGQGQHLSREEFFAEWTRATWDREYVPLAGDSSRATGERVEEVISEIEDQDSHIVIVTHGGAIADFLRNTFNEDELHEIIYEFPEGKDFRIDECSITTVGKEGNIFTLMNCHQVSHLLEL